MSVTADLRILPSFTRSKPRFYGHFRDFTRAGDRRGAAAMFSLTDALLFEPTVGVRNASELVDIGRANQGSGFDNMPHPANRYLREHSRTSMPSSQ